MSRGNMVWKLLRKNISVGQIAGYALANLVGLTIVLTALQFWRDTCSAASDDEDGFIGRDYMIISKKVTEKGAFFGATTVFSENEIADIKAQPWTESVGEFTPSRYFVSASVDFGGRGMSTELFFESIPDEFFDVKPDGWTFDSSQRFPTVPIMISKDYLALYNFGFAASRGMPQISESLVKTIPLMVSVAGNGRQNYFPAKIVGFSSRLNTIAVPESFMEWANEVYGDESKSGEVSRLIVEVNDPGNPAIKEYFDKHGIEAAGDKLNQGKAAYFLSIASMVVMAIGLVISVLSFFILMLSIYLLLQKNREKLHDLMMLGYTPSQTARSYYLLVVAVNASIFILASVAMFIISRQWSAPFESLGLETVSPLPTVFVGAALMGAVTIFNLVAIRRIVCRNF